MAFASWRMWSLVEWAQWMWTAVTTGGDSSLLVLQRSSGKRQVGSMRLISVAPDACGAGGQASLIPPVLGEGQKAAHCSAALALGPSEQTRPWPLPNLCFFPSLSIRSSDSEEAFETPESTTPVKAPPAPPPPPPEVVPEPEVSAQPPPEEPGCGSEAVSVPDGPRSNSVEGSPFRPPSHSFSAVFDEDKPIASSGTYNLDFDNIELVDDFQTLEPRSSDSKNQDCKVSTRRKSTDSVPTSKSTLSRSLSLQASDFDGASCSGGTEAVAPAPDAHSTGSSSASSTLKRTKKPRPPSLKKKQITKKPPETPTVKETQQEPAEDSPVPTEENPASETKTESAKTEGSGPALLEEASLEPAAVPRAACPLDSEGPEGAVPPAPGGGRVQNSPPVGRKTLPLATAPEAVEVTPSDSGGQEDSPAKGLSVRLEFDYSEDKGSWDTQQEHPPPTKKIGKKPVAKMPLRRPKMKKTPEKLNNAPASPTRSPAEPNDIPIAKGTYTFDIDKWDDPNFNPFSSTSKMQESPKLPQQSYNFDPDACDESIDPFKTSSKTPSSPSKSPASFEIPASAIEANGVDGDGLNKPAKKKKTPLKTMVEDVMSVCSLFDTFRVKKSPKRSPLSDPPSQDPTPAATPDTPPVISAVVHATDEEKLAVTNQKWTCMTVDLEADKQDYPQPSDLSTFVNETKFNSPTEELDYRNSYEIEYMEKIGSSSLPQDDDAPKKQALYLMFDTSQESPVKSPAVRMSESPTPCSGSSFEETEALVNAGAKIQHPVARGLAPNQDPHLQVSEKSSQKELEAMALGTASDAIEITAPEGSFASADALLSRLAHPASLCGALDYLEPDLAEKNPPVFAQKLQEELEFAIMRIEALKLARQITLAARSRQDTKREAAHPTDVSISKTALYSRIGTAEVEKPASLLFQQPDLDSALQIARAEIITKEREVSEWKDKYEESRREVMEMRSVVMLRLPGPWGLLTWAFVAFLKQLWPKPLLRPPRSSTPRPGSGCCRVCELLTGHSSLFHAPAFFCTKINPWIFQLQEKIRIRAQEWGREQGGFRYLPALKMTAGHAGKARSSVSGSFASPGRNYAYGGSGERYLLTGTEVPSRKLSLEGGLLHSWVLPRGGSTEAVLQAGDLSAFVQLLFIETTQEVQLFLPLPSLLTTKHRKIVAEYEKTIAQMIGAVKVTSVATIRPARTVHLTGKEIWTSGVKTLAHCKPQSRCPVLTLCQQMTPISQTFGCASLHTSSLSLDTYESSLGNGDKADS
ncbi:hypothetical protein HPG69_015364 [Diceros bicornis minor]|uniref:Transforming acidic coiled-coil-containing protein C-terminal domain-containing protein n=1 Tax=Diceros bicornis minor TaxID=77932 RepID=A0A7J7FJM9_DICBM|nr:hypothetical protein HPG69_015364 [Diceros bicornis minor]